jgi:hypothetical protein
VIVYRRKRVSVPLETDSVNILTQKYNIQGKGTKVENTREIEIQELWKGGSKIIAYVPIQVINLSLEEAKLPNLYRA